ncbi:MAG: zf-HC2 domain-containing protein [Deltaproteobacteria bacterium]|nr:zf-HC2 domain-containing protein [Deltaproteobacteria bacterium]MBW2420672.1 zf-HC2 domain-containing protein [Deltaproteobacteria bacterium]
MNHSDIQALMADYLEGDLSLARRALFDAHLDGCEACGGELAEMRRTIGLLRALPSPEPPPDLVDKVMRRIREGEGQASWLDRVGSWLSELAAPRVAIPATALAAALVIALVTGDLQLDLPGAGGQPRSRELAAANSPQVRGQVDRELSQNSALEAPSLVAARAVEDAGRSRAPSATGVAGVSQSAASQPPTPAAPAAAQGDGDPSTSSEGAPGRFYVESRRGREPTPLFRGGPSTLEDPGGIVAVKTPGRLDKARPVAGSLPKDQRRLIELDGRLNFLLREPDEFARWMSTFTVAEQELWLAQFAERAQERGLVDVVSVALSESDDATGQSLAAAFASAVERSNPSNVVFPESDSASE